MMIHSLLLNLKLEIRIHETHLLPDFDIRISYF